MYLIQINAYTLTKNITSFYLQFRMYFSCDKRMQQEKKATNLAKQSKLV